MNQETIEQDQLAVIVASSPLEKTKAEKLKEMFVPYLDSMHQLEKKIAAIDKENPSAIDMKIARETRLAIAKNRTSAEKKKDELKQSVLIEGRIIDSFFGVINNTSKSIELSLSNIEKAAEIKEAARRKELASERTQQLSVYEIDLTGYDLGAMTDATFSQLLENTKAGHEKRLEDKRKEEELLIQREANERLHKERENELKPFWSILHDDFDTVDLHKFTSDEWAAVIDFYKKKQANIKLHNERAQLLTPYYNFIPSHTPEDLSTLTQDEFTDLQSLCVGLDTQAKEKQADIEEENERLKKEAEQKEQATKDKEALETKRYNAIKPYLNFWQYDVTGLADITSDNFDALLFDAQALFNKGKQEKAGREATAKQLLISLDFQQNGNAWLKESMEIEIPVFNTNDELVTWADNVKLRHDKMIQDIVDKQAAEAKRQALLAPDKEKLNALANTIDAIVMPEIANTELTSKIKELLTKTSAYTRQQAEKL